jgi:hypothetical protein
MNYLQLEQEPVQIQVRVLHTALDTLMVVLMIEACGLSSLAS